MRFRYRIFLLAIISSFSIAFLTNITTASAQTPSPTPATTCGAEVSAVGWILCPVADGVTKVNDAAWNLCVWLLTLDPLNQTGAHGTDPVYTAWTSVRDVANVVFVIFFLMIIFSQLTSVGISNYGIKKMLPRLVICAILVNVSFIVMQLAVDLSNIAGKGMYDFLVALSPTLPNQLSWLGLVNLILIGGVTALAIVGVATAIGIATAFWILVPIAISCLLALIVAMLTLVFRTAVIPVLAIFAPLAFVAYMLPNTQNWYKRWRDLLISMLMMYPLAAVVFGGARFSAIVIYSKNPGNFFNNIFGLVIMILPLFSLPFLTRMGGPILGKVSGALNGLASKTKAPIGRWAGRNQEIASNTVKNRAFNENPDFDRYGNQRRRFNPRRQAGHMRKRMVQRDAKLDNLNERQKSELGRSRTQYIADLTTGADDKYRKRVSEGGGEGAESRTLSSALNTQAKLLAEEVAAQKTLIKNLNQEDARKLADGGKADVVMPNGTTVTLDAKDSLSLTTAAMHKVFETQDIEGINMLTDKAAAGGMDQETRRAFADVAEASSNTPAWMSKGEIAKIRDGNGQNSTDLIVTAVNNNTYSADKMASASKDEMTTVSAVVNSIRGQATLTPQNVSTPLGPGGAPVIMPPGSIQFRSDALSQLGDNAVSAQSNPIYAGRIGKQSQQIADIASISHPLPQPPPPPPPTPPPTP